jgi:hypothetical protein
MESEEANSASREDEIIPKKGSNVFPVIWKWFGFKRSDFQHTKKQLLRKAAAQPTSSITCN